MADAMGVDMPICGEAYRVLHEGKSPYVGMKDLMGRRRTSELSTGEERWVMR